MEKLKYIILAAINIDDLERQVNDYIDNGYIPTGGIGLFSTSNGVSLFQAIYKQNVEIETKKLKKTKD